MIARPSSDVVLKWATPPIQCDATRTARLFAIDLDAAIEIALAEGLPLPVVPKGVKISDRHFTYLYLISGSSLQSALADCDESLRLKPNYTAALVNRGLVLLRLAELDRAVTDFDAALRLAPKYALALYGRGAAKLKKGDVAGGNADMTAAITLNSNVAKDFGHYGLTVATQATPDKPVL